MMLCDCFDHFREACDELLRLGAEENHLLRTEQGIDEEFLDRKRGALEQLDRALSELRRVPATEVQNARSTARELKAQVQQKLMQLLLLDRENEQLLLRTSLRQSARQIAVRPDAKKVTTAYEQFTSK